MKKIAVKFLTWYRAARSSGMKKCSQRMVNSKLIIYHSKRCYYCNLNDDLKNKEYFWTEYYDPENGRFVCLHCWDFHNNIKEEVSKIQSILNRKIVHNKDCDKMFSNELGKAI